MARSGSQPDASGEESGEQDGDDPGAAMHIVLDDLLQPDAHMDRGREDQRDEGERDRRAGEIGPDLVIGRADMADDRDR